MRIKHHDTDQSVLVIAEIGNNHEGDLATAQELVRQAAQCGADAVKFQTFHTDHYVNPNDRERIIRMKRFELTESDYKSLCELAHAEGLLFISTPFDLPSVDVLRPMVDAYKIASGDNDFLPLIERCAEVGKPLIISSGASDLTRIKATLAWLECLPSIAASGLPTAVLHCVSNYPTEAEDANLRAIEVLRQNLWCDIGYSDHTLGVEACVLSIALGARIVEKHFTLDKNFSDFRDHTMSADPDEMAELVRRVREAEVLLGSRRKCVLPSEEEMSFAIRRSIVAARDLTQGETIEPTDITWMRPGSGLSPGREDLLLGMQVNRSIQRGEPIQRKDVA